MIAEGHALVSAGFRVVLESEPCITVVAEAGTGEEAVALAHSSRPDVVLMDLGLTGTGSVETTRRIVADTEARVLMLGLDLSDQDVLAALRAGASGVLLKSTDAPGLVSAVTTVAAGQPLLSPSLARRLLSRLARLPQTGLPKPGRLDALTEREREVVALVAHGLANDQIAERLVVSPATAKTHVSRAMVKLRARDRSQLVVLAYESGLVIPPAPQTL
jgi:DNA-binding NarL/FixJ family response regulator